MLRLKLDINKTMKTIRRVFLWLIALLFIGKFYPCIYTFVWFNNLTSILCMLFCFAYIGVHLKKFPILNVNFWIVIGIWWVYHFLRIFIYGERESLEVCNSLIYSIVFIAFCIISLGYRKTWVYFLRTHELMLYLSMIGIAILAFGVRLPLISDYTINEHQRILNYGFFFMKTHDVPGVDNLLFARPSGFYDEPGSFAFMILLILIFNKLFIKNKAVEKLFLFGGLITLSLAHVVTVIMYYVFFMLNRRNAGIAIAFLLIIVALYITRPIDNSSYLYSVWDMVFGRFEDFIAGEDMSRDYDASFLAFKDFFITGGSQNEILAEHPAATRQTLWFFLARYGIIGTLIYFLIFICPIYSYIKNRNWDGIKLLVLLLANFVQRPYLHFPIIMLLVFMIYYTQRLKYTSSLTETAYE